MTNDVSLEALFHGDALVIIDALRERARYRYVQPVLLPAEPGWKVVSPCCSRNVDKNGGMIDVAWFEPIGAQWRLHWRDHQQSRWVQHSETEDLQALLDIVCLDSERVFWP